MHRSLTPLLDEAQRRALRAWLRRPRYEVIPLAGVADRIIAHLPAEVTLTVTAPAARGLEPTLALAERLAGRGRRVVPHLAARLVRDEAHLGDVLRRLAAAGTDEVFVVGGDSPEPVGSFPDATSLLDAMAARGHPFRHVGVAGYPEGHPFLPEDVLLRALLDKRRHATYLVSNLCFDAGAIADWLSRVRRLGVTLPIHVGVPGPVDMPKLVRMAARIGPGDSARFLRRHGGWTRLLLPGVYRPDRLLAALAASVADQAPDVAGVHVFTFNDLARAERWRRRWLDRLG
jgi:methylenetetrahydrofolate reductase (NADPH)